MKKVAVIGLNNFSMEIARELSLEGSYVTVIDKDTLKIDQIAKEVTHTVLANMWDTEKIKNVDFNGYDMIILVMTDNMDLVLASMIYLRDAGAENLIICTENQNQAMVAESFIGNKGWRVVRLEKLITSKVKSILKDFEA